MSQQRENRKRSIRDWSLVLLIRVMRLFGVNMDLLVKVREGESISGRSEYKDRFHSRWLDRADLPDLVKLEPDADASQLEAWFREGKLCFGIWEDHRLIAKMWCDLDELYHPDQPIKLADDEVYLLLAFVDTDYRGHGLASRMRAEGFDWLRQQGRTRFYSYSRYFNSAARRFKAKLGAREEALLVHIQFFGHWSKSLSFQWNEPDTADPEALESPR